MRRARAVSARCEDAAPVTTHRPTCPERQSDLCQGAKRKTSKTALRRLLQRTDRANQWSFVRASHVPFDAEVGASYAPIAHRLARGGGFHLCELASTATRVGLSNFRAQRERETAVGPGDRRVLAKFFFYWRSCTPPHENASHFGADLGGAGARTLHRDRRSTSVCRARIMGI